MSEIANWAFSSTSSSSIRTSALSTAIVSARAGGKSSEHRPHAPAASSIRRRASCTRRRDPGTVVRTGGMGEGAVPGRFAPRNGVARAKVAGNLPRPCAAVRRRSRPDCGPPRPAKARVAPGTADTGGEGDGFAQRVRVTRGELGDPRLVLLPEHRARRVEQRAVARQQRPERLEDRALRRRRTRRRPSPGAATWRRDGGARRRRRCRARRRAPDRIARRPTIAPAGWHRPRAPRRRGPSRPRRARLSRTRWSRAASLSSAVIATSASSSTCEVLPPGAAHASSTRMPSRASRSGAASCAPRSCTENAPSAKPGSVATGLGAATTIPASPSARASMPSAANRASSASRAP